MMLPEDSNTPDIVPPGPKRISRRELMRNFLAVGLSVVAGDVVLDFLQRVPPPFAPLSYEGVPQLGYALTIPETTIKTGIRLVADGDSYQEGYQGAKTVGRKTINKPFTPPAGFLVEEQREQGRNWILEMHADQGETSDITLKKALAFWKKEYFARLAAKRAGMSYDPRPIWVWHWVNGNDARKPASDKKLSAEVAKLDRDGIWTHLGEFSDSVEALDDNTRDMSNNIFLTLMIYRAMEMGLPPPDIDETEILPIPMIGVQLQLTWNKAEVPTLPFVPLATDTPVSRRTIIDLLNFKGLGRKVFNLGQDSMARWAALITSQDVVRAYKIALQKFMTVPGDFIEKISVVGTEQYVHYNNGTEHPNPHGDYLISRCVASNTNVALNNGRTSTLAAITPKTHAV